MIKEQGTAKLRNGRITQTMNIVRGEKNMKPIKSEEDRQERIAKIKRQLGSPWTSPQKRSQLAKYLNKLTKMEEVAK